MLTIIALLSVKDVFGPTGGVLLPNRGRQPGIFAGCDVSLNFHSANHLREADRQPAAFPAGDLLVSKAAGGHKAEFPGDSSRHLPGILSRRWRDRGRPA